MKVENTIQYILKQEEINKKQWAIIKEYLNNQIRVKQNYANDYDRMVKWFDEAVKTFPMKKHQW